ncbi:UNVERIFIED_CONTAM: hypothetical protein GTU68_021856, partial [Idotea baltica]|nr:hypothetical protein [Idotea baltica]
VSFSIGSNINDRAAHLEQAISSAGKSIGVVKARSSFYETSSWGFDSAPFLNAVIVLQTDLSPIACLRAGLNIEIEMGRKRKAGGYSDRVIDLDILTY